MNNAASEPVNSTTTTEGKRHPWYHWDNWFRMKSFTLVKGKHFTVTTQSMALQARIAARRRGIRITVKRRYGKVIVHVLPEE